MEQYGRRAVAFTFFTVFLRIFCGFTAKNRAIRGSAIAPAPALRAGSAKSAYGGRAPLLSLAPQGVFRPSGGFSFLNKSKCRSPDALFHSRLLWGKLEERIQDERYYAYQKQGRLYH
jgi:hypothetical protein